MTGESWGAGLSGQATLSHVNILHRGHTEQGPGGNTAWCFLQSSRTSWGSGEVCIGAAVCYSCQP